MNSMIQQTQKSAPLTNAAATAAAPKTAAASTRAAKNARARNEKRFDEDSSEEIENNKKDLFHAPFMLSQRCHLSRMPHRIEDNAPSSHPLCSNNTFNALPRCFSQLPDAIHPRPQTEFAIAKAPNSPDRHAEPGKALISDNGSKLSPSANYQAHVQIQASEESSISFTLDSEAPHINDSQKLTIWNNAIFRSESWDLTNSDSTPSLKNWKAGSVMQYKGKRSTVCSKNHVKDGDVNQFDVSYSGFCSHISGNFSPNSTASAVAGSNLLLHSEDSMEECSELDHQEIASSVGSSPADHERCEHFPDTGVCVKKALLGKAPSKYLLAKRRLLGKKLEKNPTTVPNVSSIKPFKMQVEETKLKLPASMYVQEKQVDEEDRVRAELEIEIEQDLEKEIKGQIALLNRRLDDLHCLQMARYMRQQQPVKKECEGAPKSVQSYVWKGKSEKQIYFAEKRDAETSGAHWPASKCESQVKEHAVNGMMPEGDKQQSIKQRLRAVGFSSCPPKLSKSRAVDMSPSSIRKGAHFSYARSPIANSRRMLSGAPKLLSLDVQRKDKSCTPLTDMTRTPRAGETQKNGLGLMYTWTSLRTAQKFDWIKTLRSGVSSTPRLVSRAKLHDRFAATEKHLPVSSLPATDTSSCVRIARNLFPAGNLSVASPCKRQGTTKNATRNESNPFTKVQSVLCKDNYRKVEAKATIAVHKKCQDPDIMQQNKIKEKHVKVRHTMELKGKVTKAQRLHCDYHPENELSQKAMVALTEKDSLDALVLEFESFLQSLASNDEADCKASKLECEKAITAPLPGRERYTVRVEAMDCLEKERGKLPRIKTCRDLERSSNSSSPRDSGCVKRAAEGQTMVFFFSGDKGCETSSCVNCETHC